jgi:hypothetical protein
MDRSIIYAGQIPYERDLLSTNRYALVGVGKLAEALLGTISQPVVSGFAATVSGTTMTLTLGKGQIYHPTIVDSVAYTTALGTDSNYLIKQGVKWSDTTLTIASVSGVGQERVDVVQAVFQEVDDDDTLLSYFNAADPSVPLQGVGGNNAQQPRRRTGEVVLSVVEGTEANAGAATAPAITGLGIYTIRSLSATSSLAMTATAGATGVYQEDTKWVSVGGSTAGVTAAAGNALWAQLAAANIFASGIQTIDFNDPAPLIVKGGASAAGTGIKLIDSSGAANPGKTLRSSSGAFRIENDATSDDLLVLSDAGEMTVKGAVVIEAQLPTAITNDETLITKRWADATYTSGTGYISTADYVSAGGTDRVIDAQGTANQQLQGLLEYSSTALPVNWAAWDGNELVTKGAVATHFGSLGGMDEAQTLAICLPKTLTQNETVTGGSYNVTFSTPPKTTATDTETVTAGGQALISKGYAEASFLQNDIAANGSLDYLVLDGTPTAAQPTRAAPVGYLNANYNKKTGGTYTGTHDFTGVVLVPTGAAGTAQAATMVQVDALIATAVTGSSSGLLSSTNTWSAANTFGAVIAFSGELPPTLAANPDETTGGSSLMKRAYADARYLQLDSGPEATTVALKTPIKLTDTEGTVRLASSSGEPVVYEQLAGLADTASLVTFSRMVTFQGTANINSAEGTSHDLTFHGADARLRWNEADTALEAHVGEVVAARVKADGLHTKGLTVTGDIATTGFGTTANINSYGHVSAEHGPHKLTAAGAKICVRPADWAVTGGRGPTASTTGSVQHPAGGSGTAAAGGLRQHWQVITIDGSHASGWKLKTLGRPAGWDKVVNVQVTVANSPSSASDPNQDVSVNLSGSQIQVFCRQARSAYVLMTGW